MALHKFNVFHWHLTDDQGWRFEVPEYPKLVKVGSVRMDNTLPEEKYGVYDDRDPGKMFYTEKDIKDVINYAAKRCITIIPEVEFPGHVSALLASYPELGCTGGPTLEFPSNDSIKPDFYNTSLKVDADFSNKQVITTTQVDTYYSKIVLVPTTFT